jgi:hypothetical protein
VLILWNIQGQVWWSLRVSTYARDDCPSRIPCGLSRAVPFRPSCDCQGGHIFCVVVQRHWWPHVYKLLKFIARPGHEPCLYVGKRIFKTPLHLINVTISLVPEKIGGHLRIQKEASQFKRGGPSIRAGK